MTSSIEKGDIHFVEDRPDSVHTTKPHQIVQIDNFRVLGLDPDDAEFYINYSEEKRKRVVHKVRLNAYGCLLIWC